MTKSLARLKLFVSATSELQAERRLLEDLIGDVNRVVEDAYGVTIRPIDWRRDVVPGVGTDPQHVINAQAAEYEIYFGMLGARFGTPTPRAGSGTEEEFNAAYRRFRKDPRSVRLLFYFRTGFPGGLMDVDSEQLRRVQEFRSRLSQEAGVLFCDFVNSEQFIQFARNHLIQLVAAQWAGEAWRDVLGLEPTERTADLLTEDSAAGSEEDEPGILDLRVRQDDAFESAMTTVRQISELMSNWSVADRQWTAKIEAASKHRVTPKEAHTVVNLQATEFGRRAKALRGLRATYGASADEFFEALTDLVEFQVAKGLSTTDEMKSGLERIVAIDSICQSGARHVRSCCGVLGESF